MKNVQEIDFDFGFTAVNEEELDAVQTVTTQVEAATSELEKLQDKVNKLRAAIEPLLKNLEANPDKAYIHWPDRPAKVKQFRTMLDGIVKS
jgi:cell division protein FtsB